MSEIEKDIIRTQIENMSDEEQIYALRHFSDKNISYESERRLVERKYRLDRIRECVGTE